MRHVYTAAVLLFALNAMGADRPAPAVNATLGKPGGYQWLVLEHDTWNAANAQIVLADGDPYTIALPTQDATFPWLILRRVPSGAIYVDPEAPFVLETFDTMDLAIARFSLIASDHAPTIISTVDGKFQVVSLRQPAGKSRAVRR